MATRRIPSKTICCIAVAALLTQADAGGAQEVIHVRPLFDIAQVYDSNLFSTPSDREADFVTRVSPGVEAKYRSALLDLLGRYTLDAERFAQHPELTSMEARQAAGVDFRYRLTHRLALAADAELSTTHTPSELNTETFLTLTRAVAQRVAAHSSMTRQLDKATAAAIDYRFTSYRIAGGIETSAHDAAIGADRHVSSRDTVSLDYRLRQFDFGTSSATSHALGFGWTRALTRRTRVSVDAGPRLTNGSPAPDLSASLRYQFTPGDLAVAYARTQTTVIGLAGVADTQSLTVTSAWSPRPSLQVRVSPAFYRSTQAALRANVYHVAVGIARPLADGLSLDVAFDADLQDGSLYTPLAKARIPRRDLVIRLVAAPAARPR